MVGDLQQAYAGAGEDFTSQIAGAINDALQPQGVAVVIQAQHFCMCHRGVQQPDAVTTTSKGCTGCSFRTRLRVRAVPEAIAMPPASQSRPSVPAIGLDIGGTKTELVVLSDGAVAQSRTELLPGANRRLGRTTTSSLVHTLVFVRKAHRGWGMHGWSGRAGVAESCHRHASQQQPDEHEQPPVSGGLAAARLGNVRVSNDANCMTH